MVKPVNTPIAYTETSRFTLASVARRIGDRDDGQRARCRLEKTSRCPRMVSWRGRNESSATKLARNGKPLKLVFAPVNRISIVAAWNT